MVDTGSGTNKIFQQVEKIQISDMHHQAHVYFGLLGIENFGNKVFPKPVIVSALKNLYNNTQDVQKSLRGCAQI